MSWDAKDADEKFKDLSARGITYFLYITHLCQKEQMNKQIFWISINFKNARNNISKILLRFLN